METITEKCISEIRDKILIAKSNVERGMDGYKEFDIVYDYMVFAHKCGLLNEEVLNTLWNELQVATNPDANLSI